MMNKKIKILKVLSSTKRGGVPVNILNLIKNIAKGRFSIEIAAPDDGVFFARMGEWVKMHKVKIRGFYPATLFYLRRLIKAEGFDIIHAHGRGAGLYARLACLGIKTKVLYTYHGFFYLQYPIFIRWIYLAMEKVLSIWTDKIICVSQGERNLVLRTRVLINQREALVIPNGIEPLKSTAKESKNQGYVIGTLSKICVQKGLEYLVPAVAELKKKYPSLVCFIAGEMLKQDRKRELRLKDMVQKLGLERSVVFLGPIDDVASFLERIDLYVSASLWEGLPTAILEAALARVPIVATDVVGNNEIIIKDKTGVLVKAKDSHALCQAIDFAFNNREKMKRLSEKAYEHVLQNYSPCKMYESYENLYKNLIDVRF